MNNFFLLVISNIIAVPLAYLSGYKLRKYVSKQRRFAVGFAAGVSVLTIATILGLAFPMVSTQIQSVATAVAIGFPLGVALPSRTDFNKQGEISKK